MTNSSYDLNDDIYRFEGLIMSALNINHGGEMYPPEMKSLKDADPLFQIDIGTFYNEYIKYGLYPEERLSIVIHYLFDIKLQYYYLREFDFVNYGRVIGDGYNHAAPETTPNLLLARFAIDQSVITRSRILWERQMNLIYFLEEGVELERKVTGRKSKRKIFFEFISKSEKWKFLSGLDDVLTHHDNKFRTPEIHKKSTLRSEFLGKKKIDVNEILVLVNSITPFFWESIISVIRGKKVTEKINTGLFGIFKQIENEKRGNST